MTAACAHGPDGADDLSANGCDDRDGGLDLNEGCWVAAGFSDRQPPATRSSATIKRRFIVPAWSRE